MSFLSIIVLITVISLFMLILPILKPRPIRMDSQNMNAAILKEQIIELENDLKEETISQEQFSNAKADLELNFATSINPQVSNQRKTELKDKIIGIVFVVLLVPLIGFITYQEIKPEPKVAVTSTKKPQATSKTPSILDMVKGLEKKLKDNPENVDGWIVLARSYDAQGNKNGAVNAYRKALKLSPKDSWVMAQLGYALSEVSRSLEGEPVTLFKQALEISPNNLDARFLLGKYHFQTKSYQKAIDAWEYLLSLVKEKDAIPVRQALNAAKAKLGISPSDVVAEAVPAQNYIDLAISLDPKIKSIVSNNATVFVYAQAKTGSKMPLAAKKINVADLPTTVRLDDSMAMVPNFKLSKFKEIKVSARVSNSGNATVTTGDYLATLNLNQLNKTVKIIISDKVK